MLAIPLVLAALPAAAALTLYNGESASSSGTATASAASSTYTAFDTVVLTAPSPPSPATTTVAVTLPADPVAEGYNVSIAQRGNFLGFSIELSVANTILGENPASLQPNFLNYLANIKNRAGQGPIVRVGGNTQEDSSIFTAGLADGKSIDKITRTSSTTPIINYSPQLLETMANITGLIGTEWYFGLSFNESEVTDPTGNPAIAAQYAQAILGSSLKGMALGNEPDLYVDHSNRPEGWGISNYTSEWATSRAAIEAGGITTEATLMGPSVCCEVVGFELEDVFNAGWLTDNVDSLAAVTVQHYPADNCQINGVVIEAQDIFSEYLNHTSAQYLTAPYLNGAAIAQAAGKDMVMLEFNSASCGGWAGLSDSFGIGMWLADWALQLAWGNFSSALMHVGGQSVYYNPFTPPPSNQSTTREWTTGSVYYSSLVVAEALGSSNASQVVDMLQSADDMYNPVYAIYENGAPTRAVLFNYVTDASGASDYTATISLPSTPTNATVRYLRAPSVTEQYNITWAGQTLGTSYECDGRMYGDVVTEQLTCADNACTVTVPAPAIAVVFFSADALDASSVSDTATATYATTVVGTGSATVNPSVLATSNGQNGPLGSASEGSADSSDAARSVQLHVGLGVLALTVAIMLSAGRAL
ncbi:hypothetical protein Q5752_006073 [Cryptotrichosporon argae]